VALTSVFVGASECARLVAAARHHPGEAPERQTKVMGQLGSAEATPLQSPPELDDRLGFPQRTAGDLLESF
jgi:hypothetical protein